MSNVDEKAPEQEPHPAVQALRGLCKDENQPLKALYVMMCLEVGGFAMCIPVIAFFSIKELGLTPSQVGFVISCNAASQLFGSWACGRMSDTFGRRWLLLGSFGWATMGIGLTVFVQNFTQLLILRSLQGLSGGTTTLSQAYVLDSVSQAEHPQYMALFGSTMGLAFLSGNVIGIGLVAAGLERRTIFLVAAFFCLLATLYGCATITESLDPKRRRPLWSGSPRTEARSPRTSDLDAVGPGLVCSWATRFFQSLSWAVMFSTYGFLIDSLFGWSDMHMGAVMAASGLLYTVLQFVVYPLFGRHGQRGSATALLVSSMCGICAAFLLPLPGIITHVLGLSLLTLTAALFNPAIPVLVALFAGSRHIGFANGVAQGCEKGAGIIGPVIGGMLYERSVWQMFSFGGACYVFCVLGATAIFFLRADIEDDQESKPISGLQTLSDAKA